MKDRSTLFWVDLEMTGLDPQKDTILEIASLVTDNNLNVVAVGPHYVIHQSDEVLANMNDWCKDHHAKTGLTEESRKSTVTMQQAQEETLQFLKEHCVPRHSLLCGNSVWMDKLFLKEYMPLVTDFLHYRIVDVSSIKQLVALWYPNSPHLDFKKKETHRALADIQESIDELKQYRKYFFVQ